MMLRLLNVSSRVKWRGTAVKRDIRLGMSTRVKIAAQMLRDRVVVNISRPVTKVLNSKGRRVVDPDSRSKPGEFPKADTTRLMKDIFWRMESKHSAIVGTTLDYGLLLETRMDRSFLRRTHREQLPVIRKILLSGPRLPGQV